MINSKKIMNISTKSNELKILITGVTGFIGQNLVPKLLELDHQIYSLERYVTSRYVLGKKREVRTVFGDIKQHFAVRRIVQEVQPDVVINLAAISPVSYSYDHPHEVIETNFIGTVNLAESCLRDVPHLKQFLFASTSETYGNGPTPKKEETPQHPNSPYAVSKLAAEKYLLYMHKAYGFPVTILRPFNTYGRKDNTHFVVERIITQMLQGKELRLGDSTPVRDFMYVDDHINAYLTCLADRKSIGQIFNFCTGYGVTISELVETLKNLTGFDEDIAWHTIPQRPLDIKRLIGDYSKAKNLLCWEPKFSLDEGLSLCVDYWREKIAE